MQQDDEAKAEASEALAVDPGAWTLAVTGRRLRGTTLGDVLRAEDDQPRLLVFLRHFG